MKPVPDPYHEPRPRDFIARFSRTRAVTIGARGQRQHRGRRVAVLLAAVAVPAVAAPGTWGGLGIGDAGSAEVTVEPMPFERAGDSFPGSAFYYLANDDEYYLAPDARPPRSLEDGSVISDSDGAPALFDPLAGPAARALRVDNSGIDRSRALQCLTAAIYYEAASEPDAGQRAVAQVVLNRVAHPSYPDTVCGVVFQGSERSTGCQFSFTCDGALARRPARLFWLRAESVARAALAGYVYTPAGLATHYHTIAVHPYWAPSLAYLGTIGTHRFYRFRGRAGQPATFRFAYAGGEPMPVPHTRSAAADARVDPSLDPLAVQRAFEAGPGPAPGTAVTAADPAPARASPAPAYTAEQLNRGGDAIYRGGKLPEAHGVRPEYRSSGQWIAQPGT